MRPPLGSILIIALLAAGLGATGASADPDELMPCKVLPRLNSPVSGYE